MRARSAVVVCALGLALAAPAGAQEATFRRASGELSVNPTRAVPAKVGAERWVELVGHDAARWGIPILGRSTATPGRRDRRQVAGFATDLPAGVLGSWDAWYTNVYARRRRCRRISSGVRACRIVRRYRFSRIVEADVRVSAEAPWNPGPGYPTSREFDLESTVIHELGHFRYPNEPHRFGCANSPLVDSIAPGEWWRAPDDWFRHGCSNAPTRPRRSAAPAPAARILSTLHRLPDTAGPVP